MPVDLPVARPFRIPALRCWFVDAREQRPEDWRTAVEIITETALHGWARRAGSRGNWCSDDPVKLDKAERAFSDWLEENPGRTYDDWKNEGGFAAVDPYTLDPRLGIIQLVARRPGIRGDVIGGAILQNVSIIETRPRLHLLRYTPVIGIRPPERMSLPRAWGHWGVWQARNDIPARGRIDMRLAEADLPSSEDMSFARRPGADIDEMWSQMIDEFDELESDGEAPTRVRARRDRGNRPARRPFIGERRRRNVEIGERVPADRRRRRDPQDEG